MRRGASRVAAALASAWLLSMSGASANSVAAPILRIELENYDQMQFFGKVSVGSPPQEFRVIFDTGSSDVWLADEHCDSCAAFARRYAPSKSSTFAPSENAFRIEYGSGVAAGMVMRETLRLGGALEIAHVVMGQVNTTTQRLRSFHADGIVGLGLESLALITRPGLFAAGESTLLSVFSIYISPLPSSTPPSQLILGGTDPEIATLVSTEQTPQWHYFPLIPYPERKRMGFWAIRLQEMAIPDEHDLTDDGDAHAGSASLTLSRDATAIVDSGTSLILLPPRVFNATIDAIIAHLQLTHHVSLLPSSLAISGFTCKGCSPRMFPRLAFTFDSTTLHLQGVDYVRCDGAYCSPQLDSHTLFRPDPGHRKAPTEEHDVIVLGAVFLRAYYTVFDAHNSRVGFACAQRGCRGGRLPEMRFAASLFGRGITHMSFWRRVYFAVGAMLVLLAIALLWQLLTPPPSPVPKQTRRAKSTNGDCHGDRESEPEDEPSPWSATSTEDFSSIASRASRRASSFGMELLRRLSSTLAIVVVVTSDPLGSDSEESALGEPDLTDTTVRADRGATPQAATARDGEDPQSPRSRHASGNANDRAFQKTQREGPVRILTANPEPAEGMPRIRRSSVCLDA